MDLKVLESAENVNIPTSLPFPFVSKEELQKSLLQSQEKEDEILTPLKIPRPLREEVVLSDMSVQLRSESGLMTGRRTAFFLSAAWPQEMLQEKEKEAIKIFYYPGSSSLDSIQGECNPSDLWLTEKFFPGTTNYLEVQFWSESNGELEIIKKCEKHGNLNFISCSTTPHSRSKNNSDRTLSWVGNSPPKLAICFCCTPSCYNKSDPLMFLRLKVGKYLFQSDWFQLCFRKSKKRRSRTKSGHARKSIKLLTMKSHPFESLQKVSDIETKTSNEVPSSANVSISSDREQEGAVGLLKLRDLSTAPAFKLAC